MFPLLDANGLIMGEFGFITADDVYHVTVYATDENGNFKIISMKNIKLFKMPSTTTTTPAPTTTSTTPQPFRVITTPVPSEEIACAGCKIPGKENGNGKPVLTTQISQTTTNQEENPTAAAPTPFKIVKEKTDDLPQKIVNSNENSIAPGDRQKPTNSPQAEIYNRASFVDQMKASQPLQGLLYKFNYTTDFFGHHEEGDRAGNKDGGYFSVGRDNQRRIVTYKANEFGYQPYVKSELVRPEELQYYDEKNNRLKGYKFEWFPAN